MMCSSPLGLVLGVSLLVAGVGCGKDRSRDEGPVSVPVPAKPASPEGPGMRVVVSDLATDPTIDSQGVRSAFRDAESSLLGCLNEKSGVGIVAITFPIERDGAVGTLVEGSQTTLRDERTRLCIERVVGGMRFSSTTGSRPEVAVRLEVRPRRAVE